MRHRLSASQRRFFRSIPTFSGSVPLSALALAGFAQGAEPSAQADYRIGPESLDRALVAFSLASGIQVAADGKLTSGMNSPGASGRYTPEQALQKLLQGTGIAYRFSGKGAVTLEKLPTAAPGNEATLGQVTVTAKAGEEAVSYKVSNAATATKTDTPIMETPVSIKAIPKEVLDDQGVVRVADALKNVSSVQAGAFNAGYVYDTFVIRGFTQGQDIGATIFRDGARLTGFPLVTAGLERLEVIKGPASILYGRVEPGGLVNAVSKNPLAEAHYSLQQQFGSYGLYRTSFDATGPVPMDNSGDLLYRLNVDYLSRNSLRDFASEDQVYVAPKIQWNINDGNQLKLGFEYRRQELPTGFDNGIPAVGARPAKVPLGRYLGDPDHESFRRDDYVADLDFTHKFNDDWQIEYRGMYSRRDWRYSEMIPYRLDQTTGMMARRLIRQIQPDIDNRWFTSLDLAGHFSTFGLKHTLLVGSDYYRETNDTVFGSANNVPAISLYNPVYGGFAANIDTITPFSLQSEWNGVYIQDQVDITEQLHLLLGGRYDNTTYAVGGVNPPAVNYDTAKPRYGLVYQPLPWLSLYGHYAEAIGANNGATVDNSPIKPQESSEYEAGLKTELLDGKLSGTLAFYELTKENLLTPDPNNPRYSIPVGQARSKGMEIDVAGQVTERLSLIASYAYTEAKITKDNSGNEGNLLPNAPYNSGSLWAKYKVMDHFTVGAGMFAVGQRQVDTANSAQMPGYVRLDAMAAYDWTLDKSRLIAQVNVNNILDKEYYVGAAFNRNNGISPGPPLSVLGTLRLEY
jgi:iron complex outermembrane receptor protein